MSSFDNRQAINLLRSAHEAGASIEKLRAFASASRCWDEFKEGLEILSQTPTAELSVMQKHIPEPSPEVLRALARDTMPTMSESVAIVAATKRIATNPKETAAEILRRGSEYGELVITIDFDRGVYYFGQSRDGDGRTYGIHEPWTVRELTDAIKSGFHFLDA